MPDPRPWDTCFWIEGKGGSCNVDDSPRPFAQLSQAEFLAKNTTFGISIEVASILREHPHTTAKWDELGYLSDHRVRRVRYFVAETTTSPETQEFAGLIVIEKTPGIFAPLLKWCGSPIPPATIHKVDGTDVLVTARDFGGNVPMVTTWAWVWTPQGPMRLEVEKAVQQAIDKVVPGHVGYNSGIDWRTLCTKTYSWGPGEYPGKAGVTESVSACFDLRGNSLTVKRVDWKGGLDADAPRKHWP
ncbi:MAG TPA: hypothetical protein VNH18_13140 [Bryobacteraceae bacterium]|nr:hypothetical protein [Bryobacteraceae bacterium]